MSCSWWTGATAVNAFRHAQRLTVYGQAGRYIERTTDNFRVADRPPRTLATTPGHLHASWRRRPGRSRHNPQCGIQFSRSVDHAIFHTYLAHGRGRITIEQPESASLPGVMDPSSRSLFMICTASQGNVLQMPSLPECPRFDVQLQFAVQHSSRPCIHRHQAPLCRRNW